MNRACIVLLALAVSACSGKPRVTEPQPGGEAARTHSLYVASHGWHTGLIVQAEHLNDIVPELADRFGVARYYEIGWGDEGFYQAQDITVGLAIQAMFWSQGAILHVAAVPDKPARYFAQSEVLETCVSDAGLASLKTYLAASFARGAGGRVVARSRGIYGDSQFYDGEGRFYLLNTCNKWTAKALRSAGLEIDPSFKLTAASVMGALRSTQRPCDVPAAGGAHSHDPAMELR